MGHRVHVEQGLALCVPDLVFLFLEGMPFVRPKSLLSFLRLGSGCTPVIRVYECTAHYNPSLCRCHKN